MPQLIPFFFINQVTFTLITLSLIFFILSKQILPWFGRLYIIRLFINKL